MHVLIPVYDFSTLSGQPMFAYELARCLAKRGHEVTVAAQTVGGVMRQQAEAIGIRSVTFPDAQREHPDVIHASGMGPTQWAINQFNGTPTIVTIHSQWHYEDPLVDSRVRHYACVRPQIRKKIVETNGIPLHKTSVVFNGVDMERFTPHAEKFEPPTVLFVGTVDYLREKAGWDVITKTKEFGWNALFVGRRLSGWLNADLLPPHVTYMDQDVWDIEKLTQRCDRTAGILLGRTLIEGWACGVRGWAYEIDLEGQITSSGEYTVPPPEIMAQFDIEYMTDCYEAIYMSQALGR